MGHWGHYHNEDSYFTWRSGVAVAPDETVYVGYYYNGRIQAFGTAYPTAWRSEYFANRWLVEAPVRILSEHGINHDWGIGSPPNVAADDFSARWQRYAWFDAGIYRFTVRVDG